MVINSSFSLLSAGTPDVQIAYLRVFIRTANMKVLYEPGGELRSCVIETEDKCRIRCLMSPEKPDIEFITIEDSEDEGLLENAKCPLKIKEIFPCAITTGCNTSRTDDEPEHLLRCLLVKTLKEIDKPSIHIEQVCTSLSKRYKYFFTTPIYELVKAIKDIIRAGDFPENIRIFLDQKENCLLQPAEVEIVSLDSEDEEDIKVKLEIERDQGMTVDTVICLDSEDEEDIKVKLQIECEQTMIVDPVPKEVKKGVEISTQTDDDMLATAMETKVIVSTNKSESKSSNVIDPKQCDMTLLNDDHKTKVM